MITIAQASAGCDREPLHAPFSFKGNSLNELWQTAVCLRDDRGHLGVGVGTQSVLWSDPAVFQLFGERAGNGLMFAVLQEALIRCVGRRFTDPEELLAGLTEEMSQYAAQLMGRSSVNPTFILNALVAVDHAAWQLSAANQGLDRVSARLASQPVLSHRCQRLASIPVVAYGTSSSRARELVAGGTPLVKIKLGFDPDGGSDAERMLAWDCRRMDELHASLREASTTLSDSGRVAYYLDLNGRYEGPDQLSRLLEHCGKIGALEQIILVEEPFAQAAAYEVSQFPTRIVADESAQTVAEVDARIDAGYSAIALKPAAKSFSVTLAMAARAHARGVPVFCADLTANPVLADWAKGIAARLPALPGLRIGTFETNGAQNYRDWDRLLSYHPTADAEWLREHSGIFELTPDFYSRWGEIFTPSPHYAAIASGADQRADFSAR